MQLSREKPIDRIKIGELIEAAGVGRSTFYGHYAGMSDFLQKSYALMLERAARSDFAQGSTASVLPTRAILRHMAQSDNYGAILRRSREWPRVLAAAQQRIETVVEVNLRRAHPQLGQATRSRTAMLVTAGFMALIEDWTAKGRTEAPELLEAEFNRFAAAVVESSTRYQSASGS